MAGKKLNVTGITNELEGASAFFPSAPAPLLSPPADHREKLAQVSTSFETPPAEAKATEQKEVTVTDQTVPKKNIQRDTDVRIDSTQSRQQASMLASNLASMLAKVTRAIREIGKEVSYTRLTQEEKRRILDVIYSFKSKGIKITENELMRIAVNVLLEDYDLHKEGSLLHKILHQ